MSLELQNIRIELGKLGEVNFNFISNTLKKDVT